MSEPEITIDDVLRALLKRKEGQTKEDWREKSENTCQLWGPVVLYWAQEEVNKAQAERDALRAEVERLRGVIVTAENDLMNDHTNQAARVLAAEVEREATK